MRRHSIPERDASVSDKSSHFVIPTAFVICEGESAIIKITAQHRNVHQSQTILKN